MSKPWGLGAIHKLDERDIKYQAGIGIPEVLPVSYKTSNPFPVLNQALQESCVSHAWVRLLQLYWYKKTGKMIDFSPRFLHAYTSVNTKPSDGRDPRQIGNVLVGVGCCTTTLLPNDVNLSQADYSFAPITQAMLDEASQYKIPAYSFPAIDSYDIRHAIYHKGAVALLFNIGDEWWTDVNGNDSYAPGAINPLRPPKVVVGGHEVAGEHWTTIEGFENSWSTMWDEEGFAEYDMTNYQPLQVICIDDPAVDFNPLPTQLLFKFTKNLYIGMENDDVLQLQIRLGVIQTSFFGVKTLAAVMAYQSAHGITPTGFVGPITRTSLNSS